MHRFLGIRHLVIALGDWFEDARVEHAHVAGQSGDHELLVEAGDRSCRDRIAGVHQHFDPFAEAIDVEQLVASRPRVTPEVEVEHGGELGRRRRRDELAARLEPAVSNQLVHGLRRKVRDDAGEQRGVQQSREAVVVRDFGHGPAMIAIMGGKKQS
jgi:hypothetical protein